MASIKLVVQVTITKGTVTVPSQSFAIPAIMGPSNRIGSDVYRIYSDPSVMLTDGFLINDPEYIHAVELDSQTNKPVEWVIGKFTPSVAQVDTFQVNTLATGHNYTFTLNGTVLSYTSLISDAQQDILGHLLTQALAISPAVVTGAVTGTGAGATLTLTSTVPGQGVAYTAIDADLTHALLTPNHSIVQDIQTLQASIDTWYGLIVTSKLATDILQIAAYIETQLKFYLAATADAGVISSSSTTDVAYIAKQKLYTRTAILYSAQATAGADAAWMGSQLPLTPGSNTWAFKQLVGITPDNPPALGDTQINTLRAKNCNFYTTVGVPVTLDGIVASGEYIDVTIFLDWLPSQIQTDVMQVLVDSNKVPYTDKGVQLIENAVRKDLQLGQDNGGLAPGWTVTALPVSQSSTADKKARKYRNLSFQAELAGAIQDVAIAGTVSV